MNTYFQVLTILVVSLFFWIHVDQQHISYGSMHFLVNIILIASVYIDIVISVLFFIKYAAAPKFNVPKDFPIRITVSRRKTLFKIIANILLLEMLVMFFTHEGYISFDTGEIILGVGLFLMVLFFLRCIADPWHMIINHRGINIPSRYGLIKWEYITEIKQIAIDTVSRGFTSDYVMVSVSDPSAYSLAKRDSKASRLDQVIEKRRYIDYWKNGVKHKDTINFLVDDLNYAAFLEELIKEAWDHYKKGQHSY